MLPYAAKDAPKMLPDAVSQRLAISSPFLLSMVSPAKAMLTITPIYNDNPLAVPSQLIPLASIQHPVHDN